MNYEERLIDLEKYNLVVKEKDLQAHDGRIYGNRIAIRKNMTQAEKNCALAEEVAHFKMNATDIILTRDTREEHKARMCAYNEAVGLIGLIDCFNKKLNTIPDMAEYLEVTEEFLNETIECYHSKYGLYTTVDNYIIGFEPILYIMERFE